MTTANYAIAENITALLMEQKGSTNACVTIKGMSKKDQLATFGRYFGKGLIYIDGTNETVTHAVKVGFGMDWDYTTQIRFDGTVVFNNRK